MRSPDGWLAVGGAVFGAGALLVVSWLMYAFQSKGDFWSWPGITGLAVAVGGFGALAVGFVMPKETEQTPATVRQSQHAGPHSTNLQAGRDINLGADKPED